jgi:hypothetical protein
MNPKKQHQKLHSLSVEADQCTTREEAQRIIRKADKVHSKLAFHQYYYGQIPKGKLV